jgi:hypothetical protein
VHAVLCCAPVYNTGTLRSVSPQTPNAVRSHQHPPDYRAAPPGGGWQRQGSSNVFMPLCCAMQRDKSLWLLNKLPCAPQLRLPRMQSPSAHSWLHAGAALQQCNALTCSESYVRAAPSARLQPLKCHQTEGCCVQNMADWMNGMPLQVTVSIRQSLQGIQT